MKKHFVIALMLLGTAGVYAATPKKLANTAPTKNAFEEGERLVYTRLVEAFRKNDLAEVTKQRQLLERNYPQSVHLDNAYYLTGTLEFQQNQIGESIRTFNTVTDKFPKSNKRPAALFGLAMSYKRLNLKPLSVKVLQTITKEYPGSPESQRAWMHLRLEKAGVKR